MTSGVLKTPQKNIILNHCSNITITQSDRPVGTEVFDIILANINRNVILSSMDALRQHLAEDGVLIGSGVLPGDEEKLKLAATAAGFNMTKLNIRDNWMCFALKKQENA